MLPVQSYMLLLTNLSLADRDGAMSSSSRLDCARLCFQQHHCSSFFYNNINNSCLTSRTTLAASQLSHSEGGTYYAIRPQTIQTSKTPKRSRKPTPREKDSKKGRNSKRGPKSNRGCPRRWKSRDNKCYRLVKKNKSWFDAKSYCERSLDGRLAQADTEAAIIHLSSFYVKLKLNFFSSHESYWLGGIKVSNSTVWTWSDGSVVKVKGWRPEEGSDNMQEAKQLCMDQYFAGWNDDVCHLEMFFLCEKRVQ